MCLRWLPERRRTRGSLWYVTQVKSLPSNALASVRESRGSQEIPAWKARFSSRKLVSVLESTNASSGKTVGLNAG